MLKQKRKLPDEILEFANLSEYSWQKRVAIRIISILLFYAIKLIGSTLQFEVEGWSGCEKPGWETYEIALKNQPATVVAFWHNRLFLATYHGRNFGSAIMVSKSFDGEYVSRTAQRFGYGVVRGSSSRDGSKALMKMVRLLKDGYSMSFTIDGPRGPRYKVKSGAVLLAKKTGVPIIPISYEAKSYWELNSWDKLQVPKPFTKARMFLGKPIFLDDQSDEQTMAETRKELQRKLDELVLRGKQWRESKR